MWGPGSTLHAVVLTHDRQHAPGWDHSVHIIKEHLQRAGQPASQGPPQPLGKQPTSSRSPPVAAGLGPPLTRSLRFLPRPMVIL